MNLAYRMQAFQDWFTQQWVILWGRKINPADHSWLMGPFGELNGIGETFIEQLAEREHLLIRRNCKSTGLLASIHQLHLPEKELNQLSGKVIDFYERTADYQLNLNVTWNPLFKPFGYLVNRLFSQRINQLNIPTSNRGGSEQLTQEIIQLASKETGAVHYTIWLRKFPSTGKVIYSGIYTTCTLPSKTTCIKAVFPLPKGNATVILKPTVGLNHELQLTSSGARFGDAGFYFLLTDSKGIFWSQYIRSFTDTLIVREAQPTLLAQQTLKLWNLKVAQFDYELLKQEAENIV